MLCIYGNSYFSKRQKISAKSKANFMVWLFLHCNNDSSFLLHLERLCLCNICKENAFVILTTKERSNDSVLVTSSVTHCCDFSNSICCKPDNMLKWVTLVWTEHPGCSHKMFYGDELWSLSFSLTNTGGSLWVVSRFGGQTLVNESWDTGFQLLSEFYLESKYSIHLLYQQIGYTGFPLVWYCFPISKVK